MAKSISKISRVSDLPEITHIWDGMQSIVAADGSNYIIDTTKLKGKKIVDIFGSMSTESGGKNIIYIRFDDSTTERLIVYNGSDGDKGETGGIGPVGEQGDAAIINYREKDESGRGVVGVIEIVNNSTSNDSDKLWSSLMGRNMNDDLYDINETFMTQEAYELLFENVKYIYAEFETTTDNVTSTLFNNDTSDHVVYRKYWTYEDGNLDTYYIKREDGSYDPVSVSLWDDVYLGAREGYFPITSSMNTQEIPIYYYDRQTNDYLEVEKLYYTADIVTVDDEGNSISTQKNYYLGDKVIDSYYVPELDASLYCKYLISSAKWTFTLNTSKDLTWTIWQKISETKSVAVTDEYGNPVLDDNGEPTYKNVTEERYEPLTVYYDIRKEKYYIENYNGTSNYELDTTVIQEFYQIVEGQYTIITNMSGYLTKNNIRYYKRNPESNLYYEVTKDGYSEMDDYIIASKVALDNSFIFERHWVEKIYDEDVFFTRTFTIQDIDLYYSTLDIGTREYYKLVYTYHETLDEEGNPTGTGTYTSEYVLIPTPKWIVAEFTTLDEDIDTLILNANENRGQEDNTVIDNTIEDTDTYVSSTPIEWIVPGEDKDIYHKEADGKYKLVNLNKDKIYESSQYYYLDKTPRFVEISGEEAKNNSMIELYTLEEDGTYSVYRDSIVDSNVYYYKTYDYVLIDDVNTYLRECTLNLIYGEPKLLPISIYPSTSIRENMIIEYDPTYLKFYEDGRIAAVTGDTINDTKVYVRSAKNPETIYAIIHINLLTPVGKIVMDTENVYETLIGEETLIKYTITPDNATNKNIIWSSSDEENTISIRQVDQNTIAISGTKAGDYSISGKAEDGVGGSITFRIEIITPVAKFYWDQENIKYVEPVYYTPYEVDSHNMLYPEDPWPTEPNTIIKVEGYYYINALHNKEYELKPVIEPEDVKYTTIEWTSDNQDIASARNGVLVGSNLGSTTIYAKLSKFDNVEPLALRVNVNTAITEITVTPSAESININTKKKLKATVTPDGLASTKIKWISSNEDVVKILEDEIDPVNNIVYIETVGIGNAQIIAQGYDGDEMSSVKGTSEITVTIPAKDITVNGENVSDGVIYVGCDQDVNNNTTTISAIITRDDRYTGGDIYKRGVVWSVADDSIAEVKADDEKGLTATITGHIIGRTTVIASAADGSGVFGTIQVQVIKLTENISFDTSNFEKTEDGKILMNIGDSVVLVPTFTPESTNEIVIWKSSDEAIAKVKESGIVYALSTGEATITVTSTDGSKKEATCEITIQ